MHMHMHRYILMNSNCMSHPGRLFGYWRFLLVMSSDCRSTESDGFKFCFHYKEPGIHDSKSVAKLFQIDSDINSRIPYPLVLAECLQEPQCLVESHDCDASQGQQKRRQRKIEQDMFMFKASNMGYKISLNKKRDRS